MQRPIPLMSVLLAVVILSGCNRGAANKSRAELAKARQQLEKAHAELESQKKTFENNERKLREIQIQLPPVSEATSITPTTMIVVKIGQDGKFEFDGQPATEEQLQEFLDEAVKKDAHQSITIQGHPQTPLERVVIVMSMCQRAGIDDYNVAMKEVREDR